MPIQNSARKGTNFMLANPAEPRISRGPSNYRTGRVKQIRPFKSASFSTYTSTISGVTKDSAGANLAGVTVTLFVSGNNLFVSQAVSDGSGNYTLTIDKSGPFFIEAYKVGAPDVAGTTVNTLVGV